MQDDVISKQQNFWSGKFGSSYIERNNSIDKINHAYRIQTGISVEDIFKEIFGNLDKDLSILELGCNIGTKLQILNNMGFKKLHGVEINQEAANLAQNNNPSFHIFNSSIEEFDSEKNHFDIVFTSGVLIHVDPNNITQIIKKMVNLSKKYIFGFEYFDENISEIKYRENNNVCWKMNYPKRIQELFPNLKLVKSKKIFYNNDDLCDIAYLFEKSF